MLPGGKPAGLLALTPSLQPGRARPHLPGLQPACALTSQPLAMAKPPPSSRMMLQGTVACAFVHVSRGAVSVLGAGQREDTQPEEDTPGPRTHSGHWG